ncbi:hypothetical protein VKT23_015839 [Stygiomarasmius scandens]|uniref:DUF7918 domain-containing protein n=1 Tax=Marasmiellus scandens TaxID=2682957 RepID=A0ABR1J141_9AGAR
MPVLQLGHCSACIIIDGNPAQEYKTTTQGVETTCWIASEVGKNFAVHWKKCAVGYHSIEVCLDGKLAVSRSSSAPVSADFATGVVTSEHTQKLFLFSDLESTNDDKLLHQNHAQLGEIRVSFYESQFNGYSDFGKFMEYNAKNDNAFSAPVKVHERSKVFGHRIGLGQEQRRSNEKLVAHVRHVRLLAAFVFRYRPIEFLRANGILPSLPKFVHSILAPVPAPALPQPHAFGVVIPDLMYNFHERHPVQPPPSLPSSSSATSPPSSQSRPLQTPPVLSPLQASSNRKTGPEFKRPRSLFSPPPMPDEKTEEELELLEEEEVCKKIQVLKVQLDVIRKSKEQRQEQTRGNNVNKRRRLSVKTEPVE